MIKLSRDTWILSLLTSATAVIVSAMLSRGLTTWVEGLAFVTGAICVWLCVRENVWNFPIGLINVCLYLYVFSLAKLYADAGLQVVYFLLGAIGWWMWLNGGENRQSLVISRVKWFELLILISAATLLTLTLWSTLHRVGGSASFWDALTTSISLLAQWMLNRKQLENWLAWIIVDIIYVPLYLYKELYLTALLYVVFLIMAILGYRQWRAALRTDEQQTLLGGTKQSVPEVETS